MSFILFLGSKPFQAACIGVLMLLLISILMGLSLIAFWQAIKFLREKS